MSESTKEWIYLDHGATSGKRPESVYLAVDRQLRCGGAAGRGQHAAAVAANEVVHQCRLAIARLINAPHANSVALTHGCTHALNLAIHGLIRRRMHVVTTAAEHNSVLRPLEYLRQHQSVEVTTVPCDRGGRVSIQAVLNRVRDDTGAIVITAASNVTGAVNDIQQLGQAIGKTGPMVICDAAQLVGYRSIDVRAWNVSALAIPGHKGLLGPVGTGALYVDPNLHDGLVPLLQGGTGTDSQSLAMPNPFPQKLESGNLNVPGYAGLLAGVEHLREHGLGSDRMERLVSLLLQGLVNISSVHVVGQSVTDNGVRDRVGIVSLMGEGLSVHDLANLLETEFRIQTRAGLHCAPLIHAHLGSAPQGTLRISLGHSTTEPEIQSLIAALKSL